MFHTVSGKTFLWVVLGALALFGLLYACAGASKDNPWDVPRSRKVIPGVGEVVWYGSGAEAARSVAFVHGTPGSASAWRDYFQNVPSRFNFIALDRPGFGASTDSAVPELGRQARSVVSLLPKDKGKAILVGHSLGGPIIVRAAIDFPDQIGGLVIVAGSLDPDLEKINPMQYVGRWWPFSYLLPQSLSNANLEIFALEAELEKLGQDLDRLTVPVTIIHGTKDRLVPFENVAYMEQMMTNADVEVVVLEGQNHFLPWNSKDIVDLAILRTSQILDESTGGLSLID